MRLLSYGYISLQKYEIAAIFVEFSASDLSTIMFYVCFVKRNRQFLYFTSSATCPKERFSETAPIASSSLAKELIALSELEILRKIIWIGQTPKKLQSTSKDDYVSVDEEYGESAYLSSTPQISKEDMSKDYENNGVVKM